MTGRVEGTRRLSLALGLLFIPSFLLGSLGPLDFGSDPIPVLGLVMELGWSWGPLDRNQQHTNCQPQGLAGSRLSFGWARATVGS